MSTHRRAWQTRAGVVVALIVGALLAVPATPALAATVNVIPDSVAVNAGSDATVTVQVTPGEGDTSAEVNLTGLPAGVSCVRGCGGIQLNGSLPRPHLLTLRAADNARGTSATITVQVQPDSSNPATDDFQLTVRGEQTPSAPPPTTQAPQTVRSISGKVVNQAGDGVPNAYVLLKDSAGKQYETNTNSDGNFRFTGTNDRPIAPGRIDLGAIANNVREVVSFTANAGQSITGQRITLAIQPSNSPSPTPSASESVMPTEDPFDDELTDDEETPGETAAPPAQASNENSGGFGNWLLILLGGLFVAIGVGTIVLLLIKRKDNDDAEVDGDTPAAAAAAAAGAAPAARGSFAGADDQTRVVSRVGNTPDPTMVAGPSMSDAPTVLHQPVVDDVPPDPYGAPPPAQPYGAAAGTGQSWSGSGYGDEPGGYGAPGYGNAPSSGSGYGTSPSSGAGYGGRDYGAGSDYPPAGGAAGYGNRYDEPTGRYSGEETRYPAPADPYATGLYEPEAGQGYGQSEPTGYGRGEPGGGYGRGEPTGGYGAPAGGYEQPGSYGQGGSTSGYGSGDRDYGRGEPTGGYGSPVTGGYGPSEPAGGYAPSAPPGGYPSSAPAGGYGQSEPTGSYGRTDTGGYGQSEPAGGYPSATGGYGQPSGGYGQTSGYDDPGRYGQSGYGHGGGYEPPQQRSGYDSGYDQSGGGYGQEPPRQRGAYEGGYEQAGSYGNDPTQSGRGRTDGGPAERGGRRLDWLDD